MKMGRTEKRFVNGRRHSERVAEQTVQRLRAIGATPGDRLLDVGCGNGAAAIHAATTLALDATGIDVDAEQIAAARSAADGVFGVRFRVADATALPFAEGEFDLVYTNKTTHHVPDWQQALSEMARVLNPGGHLVYSDFVAPTGRRFPTRRGIDTAAAVAGLQRLQHNRTPFHYTACFRKRADVRVTAAVTPPTATTRRRQPAA